MIGVRPCFLSLQSSVEFLRLLIAFISPSLGIQNCRFKTMQSIRMSNRIHIASLDRRRFVAVMQKTTPTPRKRSHKLILTIFSSIAGTCNIKFLSLSYNPSCLPEKEQKSYSPSTCRKINLKNAPTSHEDCKLYHCYMRRCFVRKQYQLSCIHIICNSGRLQRSKVHVSFVVLCTIISSNSNVSVQSSSRCGDDSDKAFVSNVLLIKCSSKI